MASTIELLYKIIRGTTNPVGEPVRNLWGPVQQVVQGSLTSQEQRWLLVSIPGNGMISADEFLQQYATVAERTHQFLIGQNGVVTYRGQPNRLYMLRAVLVVPSTEGVPLTVVMGGANDQFGIWVDGTQRSRSTGERSMTLALSEGKHVLEILLDSDSFAVHLPPHITVLATDDSLPAPVWAKVEAGYVDPVLGTPGVKLHWFNNARAGGWAVLRRDLEVVGRIIALGDVEASGDYVLTIGSDTVDASLLLPTGTTLYAGFEPIGVVRFVTYDPDAQLVYDTITYTGLAKVQLRLFSERLDHKDIWVGRDANSGVFREVSRVQRTGTHATVSWVDTAVAFGFGYEYALQAYGLFDPAILSPQSGVIYVRAGDEVAPGPIVLDEDFPVSFSGRITAKFTTPTDADYAGVRVYFQRVEQTGQSPGGSTAVKFVLAEAPADPSRFVGAQLILTGGTGSGQAVQLLTQDLTDTTGRTFDVAPSFAPIPDETTTYEVHNFEEVVTDYGLPGTHDELSFVRAVDEAGSPIYGIYYFVTFDHTRNQQNFEDGVVWEYDTSDDLCDGPLPPDVTLKQLSTDDVTLAIAEGALPAYAADGNTYVVVEVGAEDSCDGKLGVMIEYRLREQWDGNSTGANTATTLNDTDRVDVLYETGTATGVEAGKELKTLVDSTKTWTENQFRDQQGLVRITAGKNTGSWSYIVSNTATTLYLSPGWPIDLGAIDNTSQYQIEYHATIDTSDDPWEVNALRNRIVEITNGPGEDQLALVVNNTTTQLELAPLETLEPYYVSRGAVSKVASGDLAPGVPLNLQTGDYLVCHVVQRDNVVATMSGEWDPLITPVDNGLNMRVSLWGTFKTSGVNPDTTVTRAAGNGAIAQITAYRGVDPTSPLFGYQASANLTDLATITYPEVSGAPFNSLAVLTGFAASDGYSLNPTGSPLTLTERIDTNTALGDDAGLVVLVSEGFSGSTGTATATYSEAQRHVGVTVVLRGKVSTAVAPAWEILPTAASTYQIAWIGALPANAPRQLDNPLSGERGRLIILNRTEDNNFIIVRARDKDGNVSGERAYAADFDTIPEVSSVDIRIGRDLVSPDDPNGALRVFVKGIVDDDTQSIQWFLDPPYEGVPFEAFPETVSPLTETKTFTFDFPFQDADLRRIYIRPWSQPDAQGVSGVDWVEEIVRHPRTTLVIENKDLLGAYSATSARLTFKVHPAIVEEPTDSGVVAAGYVPDRFTLLDTAANFPVDENNNGEYNLRTSTYNWYFVEMLDGPAANKLRRIVRNTSTTLTVEDWAAGDPPGDERLPQPGNLYRIWRGATYWRKRIEYANGTVSSGPWLLTNNPEVVSRAGLNAADTILIDYFSVITAVPPEPIKTSGLDPDEIAEIISWTITEEPAHYIHVSLDIVDDDVRHWHLYARKGDWPVITPDPSIPRDPDRHPMDPDFLRLDTPITIQRQASFKVDNGVWYVIIVPYNSYGQEGPRATRPVVADGIPEVDPPTFNGNILQLADVVPIDPDAYLQLWEMVAPDAGTHDLVINLMSTQASVAAAVYTGVNQADPYADATAVEALTQTVPSATGQLVVGVAGVTEQTGSNGTFTGGSGTTIRQQNGTSTAATDYDVVIGDEAGAASVTINYTHGATTTDVGSIVVSLARQDVGTAIAYLTGGSATTGAGSATTLTVPLTISGSNTILLVGLIVRTGASIPVDQSLTNFAIQDVIYVPTIGDPNTAHVLSWDHSADIDGSSDYKVDITVQDISRTTQARTLATARDARRDYDGTIVGGLTTANKGSMVHIIYTTPNGTVTGVQPGSGAGESVLNWKYTVRFYNTVTGLDKSYTHYHSGLYYPVYGDLGTAPVISGLSYTMANGGVCVLTGSTTHIANPGISYDLSWAVANPDDENYHIRISTQVYNVAYSPTGYTIVAIVPSSRLGLTWTHPALVASSAGASGPAVWYNAQYKFDFKVEMIRKSTGAVTSSSTDTETRYACYCNGSSEIFDPLP